MSETKILQLKITLCKGWIVPQLYREVLVRDDMDLIDLHEVIQDLFAWERCHLYRFTIRDIEYEDLTLPNSGWSEGEDMNGKLLSSFSFKQGEGFIYKYDFGDDWDHSIKVRKVLPHDLNKNYPVCIGGSRNSPPEDSGGAWGYEEMLEVLADKKHPEYEERLDWMGEDFDSEEFDIAGINSVLAKAWHKKLKKVS